MSTALGFRNYKSPRFIIRVDDRRDRLLNAFGVDTLRDRYCMPGEDPQDVFARVACHFGDDAQHAQRVYDYISRLWFMPATPVLSNGGTGKGLPISCFLNAVEDSLDSIIEVWTENCWLSAKGGGTGTYWGAVRSINEGVHGVGKTSGIIPFNVVQNYVSLAISQGSQRRGASATYLDIHHPEVVEFLEIRKPSGDFNRKALNLHHGLCVTDEFMEAVRDDLPFALRSPKDGHTVETVSARDLWQKVIDTRHQTGEPYLLFTGNCNRAMPRHQRELGLQVRQSNLCSEITLHTGRDHMGKDRTAVCCLSSVNAETFLEWRDDPLFIEDVMRFLDNVLQDFIDTAPPQMAKAVYAATCERSVGLGLMGLHSFLQSQSVPFGSAVAKSWNMQMFKHLRRGADAANHKLALERGPCPDWVDAMHPDVTAPEQAEALGPPKRFSHTTAVAPTASISIICGGTSAGIEPIPANVYTHKTLSGSFVVRNKYLEAVLGALGMNDEDVWADILDHDGSIQHLPFLSDEVKEVYRTADELDQRWIVELAADRAPEIEQAQSVNLFVPGDVDKWDLHMLHYSAWERGLKSLYYLRSKSVQRASTAGLDGGEDDAEDGELVLRAPTRYDECIACQ